MLKGWSWKAILGGLAVDLIGSLVAASIVVLPYLVWKISRGELSSTFETEIQTGSFSWMFMGFGLLLDGVGGYLAATWAPTRKIAHAMMVGVLSLLSGLVVAPIPDSLSTTLSTLLIIPFAALGGWWRVRTRGAESVIQPKDNSLDGSPPISSPF